MRPSFIFAIGFAFLMVACGGDEAGDATPEPVAESSTTATRADGTSTRAPQQTSSSSSSSAAPEDGGCADVVAVGVSFDGDTASFDVTVESDDMGWDKYADAWEVRGPGGAVLGVRELLHPHVDEQPFTRSLSDVEIPSDVDEVTIAAHDSVLGFCGATVTVPLAGES